MERAAIITYRPGWTGTICAIVTALREDKIAPLPIYVEDGAMQAFAQQCLSDEGVAEKATVHLLCDKPEHIANNWRDGVRLNDDPPIYWSPLIPLRLGYPR